MSVLTYIHHFIVSNVLTIYYNILILLVFAIAKMKNPFGNPWALKMKLEPPSCLSDPKYGVHKYIKVNNIKLHYVESGDPSKPLMVFVHGFPEFWYSWRHQIVEFNKDYWCIAFDMRGYGDSERPEDVSSYKFEYLVEDIRDLVRQLGREKCILVSHDWGGLVCSAFRDAHPDAVSALVLLSSASASSWFHEIWHNPEQRNKSWYVFLYRAPMIAEKMLQMNNLEVFDKFMMSPGKESVSREDIECYKYWFGKQYTLTPPVNYYRANFAYTMPVKMYCEAKIPMLVALGENDDFLSRSLLDVMKKEYAHIETTVLNGCGHFMQQEDPMKVNKLIRDFLIKHQL